MKRTSRLPSGAAAIVAAGVALAGCSGSPAPDSDGPRTIRIAVSSIPGDFGIGDAGTDMLVPNIGQAVFDPLVMWNRTTKDWEPWLAEEYEVVGDGHTLKLTLRDDVDFVDGEHLDAEGFLAYIEAAEAQDVYLFPADFGPTVRVTGEYTLEVDTEVPIRFWFSYLVGLGLPVMSPAAASASDTTKPLGSGPYVIEEIVPEYSAKLVRNPDYWNPEAYPFDEIEFIVFDDDIARLNALTSGQIDAAPLSVQVAKEAEEEGFAIHEGVGLFPTIVFSDRDGLIVPAIGDVRVRQAINMAFDREAIRETLTLGYGEIRSQPFVPGMPEYVEGGDDYYTYDPERARELLAEAGYPDGFDFPIATIASNAPYAPVIEQSLADIGIRVEFIQFDVSDVGRWVAALQSGDYAAWAWPNAYTNVVNAFAEGGFMVIDGKVDPAVAGLLETIRLGTDEESAAASQDFGRLLLEEAWFAPVATPPTIWASIPEVTIEVGQVLGFPVLKEFQLAD